jgi:hypothetical protein
MKRTHLVLLAAVLLLVCAAPAFAGNEIVLGSSSGNPIKFVGTGGGNFKVNFNIVNLVATGFGTLSSSGFYSIVNNGATVTSGGSCGSGCFMLNQTGPLLFKYGSLPGGSDLLTGNLVLTDLVQTGGSGVFNDQLVINFTATGGDLQSAFGNGTGQLQLTIKFSTNQDLATILNNQTLLAKVISGAVFPVPEPGSLPLLGASLLGFAGLFGRKRLFSV